MKNLVVEFNQTFVKSSDTFAIGKGVVMVTPLLDDDYWIMRVKVSDDQAIVAFPKFGVIGIGFQHEDDWNTNLPSSCDAEKIYNHIKHNKGNKNIRKETCIHAIQALQNAIRSL
jgi:hypothetical protein